MKIAVALAAAVTLLASPVLGCPKVPQPKDQAWGGPAAVAQLGGGRHVPPPTRHTPVPQGPLDSVKITLVRAQCYGNCPAYKVEIAGNGEVKYQGEVFVLVPGDHIATVAPEDVRCLVDAFRAADFWSLSPEYAAEVTDLPGYYLTLSIGGRSKTVLDYLGQSVGMPKAVTGLEDAVDQLSGDELWISGDAQTLPALEAEHFDFRSRAGADLLARAMIFAVEGDKLAGAGTRDQIVLDLIAKGVPLDGRAAMQLTGGDMSAAEIAALYGRLDFLRALTKAGAFETGGHAVASAVLRASVGSQRADVVAEALQHHPDVNGQDQNGDTALHLILQGAHPHGSDNDAPNENLAIIRLLLQAGADPNIANHEGKTVLHDVLDPDQARAFVAGGARLEVRDKDGNTPLLATFTEDVAVVLIEAGADLKAKTRDGETFVEVAEGKNWRRALAAVQARRAMSGRWPEAQLDAIAELGLKWPWLFVAGFWAGAAMIAIGAIGAPFAFPWKNAAGARCRAAWALALVIPPLAAILWGQAFGVTPGAPPGRPDWISAALAVPCLMALALPVMLAATMKGARLFIALVGAACFAATLGLAFLATMQVTGAWL